MNIREFHFITFGEKKIFKQQGYIFFKMYMCIKYSIPTFIYRKISERYFRGINNFIFDRWSQEGELILCYL